MPTPRRGTRLKPNNVVGLTLNNTGTGPIVANDYFWGIPADVTPPIENISIVASPVRISKIAAFNTSTFSFSSDSALQAWQIMVVPSSGSLMSGGVTIPTTAGSINTTGASLAAGTDKLVTITGTDLQTASAGDGDKVVKIFAQDLAGNWST